MNPKRFDLYYGADFSREQEGPFILFEAKQYLYSEADFAAMDALAVGERFIDADGDAWQRVA